MVDLKENRDTGRYVEPLNRDRRESHLPAIREQGPCREYPKFRMSHMSPLRDRRSESSYPSASVAVDVKVIQRHVRILALGR